MSNNILLFGAAGRLGRISTKALQTKGIKPVCYQRGLGFKINSRITCDVDNPSALTGEWLVIDASVDYSSPAAFIDWESKKRQFVKMLYNSGRLHAYVSFSSGITEFDRSLIDDSFKEIYRREKQNLENFVTNLLVPAYCPRIFTLIGRETWNFGRVGWVEVAKQIMQSGYAGVGFPDEKKSWVAETTIEKQLGDFVSGPVPWNFGVITPLDGIFTLRNIAEITATFFSKAYELEPLEIQRWLLTDYLSSIPHKYDLDMLSREIVQLIGNTSA